jgi:outer membrane biosynthesis protein TonB
MAISITQTPKDTHERDRKVLPWLYTFLYFSSILLLLFFIKLSAPVEFDEGQGLLVDFGYTETGLGTEDPDAKNPMNNLSIPQPGNPPFTQTIKEKVLIQDQEETEKVDAVSENTTQKVVVVENVLKSTVKSETKTATPNNSPKIVATEKNKVNENLLFKGFKGNGTGTGSQGNTAGDGNMGDPSGSKSDNYLGKNTGLGSEGDGRGRIGTGLIGRKMNSIPPIVDNSNKTGKIIVKVNVGADGKVIKSDYVAQGSTITDSDLITKCINAAKKAKFTADEERDSDWGTLVFTFEIR